MGPRRMQSWEPATKRSPYKVGEHVVLCLPQVLGRPLGSPCQLPDFGVFAKVVASKPVLTVKVQGFRDADAKEAYSMSPRKGETGFAQLELLWYGFCDAAHDVQPAQEEWVDRV